ncbi:hypothetical protein CYY_008296 [Polysphondylium violaceum]|uniref:PA14 domain-containing protein n=1 Tax=Polysphondylium violaceum TaxID=133409 RepID=A0A8J4PN58_9MYCE|nr:hypothetical protein CYY_008296 [Polysphondylium violaceum]
MKKYSLVNIVTLIVLVQCILLTNAQTKKFQVTFRDLAPETNPDFEIANNNSVITGLVKPGLNQVDRSPVYCCGDNPAPYPNKYVIHNQTTFYSWFHNVKNVNVEVQSSLEFTRNTTDPRIYYFKSDAFFPLDNRGFQDPNYNGPVKSKPYPDANGFYHNYHFCMEMHASFSYLGAETFYFKGDDDVWVFIDNKLVMDLGAPHDILGNNGQGSVNLDDLGLTLGKTYNFDFFYCERHSVESHIFVSTSIGLECKYVDYCGVCEGTGKCCDPNQCTSDKSPCDSYRCPKPTEVPSGRSWKPYCPVDILNCSLNNTVCTKYECDPDSKQCVKSDMVNNNPCGSSQDFCNSQVCDDAKGGCIPKQPCVHETKTDPTCYFNTCQNSTCQLIELCDDKSVCTTDSCIGNNSGCKHLPISCDDGNRCTTDSCDPVKGCQHTNITNCLECKSGVVCNSDPNNKCIRSECDPINADKCIDVQTINCDDSNACTTDSCDPATGTCINKLKDCSGAAINACSKTICNSTTGACQALVPCDDGIKCTDDLCATNGTCIFPLKTCDDKNVCTLDSCQNSVAGDGCVHKPIVCKEPGICNVTRCDPALGCLEEPMTCVTDAFCLEAECNPNFGGCVSFPKVCVPPKPSCQYGVCSNETKTCVFVDFSPLPFKCQSTAVKAGVAIGAAAIAGIVIGGAVAVGLAIFGGKKGYDAWKSSQAASMAVSAENPLYVPNPNQGTNPLYNGGGST